jgi:hypothetical protein
MLLVLVSILFFFFFWVMLPFFFLFYRTRNIAAFCLCYSQGCAYGTHVVVNPVMSYDGILFG